MERTKSLTDKTRKWIESWKRADAALRAMKRLELREYDHSRNIDAIDGMLRWAVEHGAVRMTSGLVEQQRLFMKWKNR